MAINICSFLALALRYVSDYFVEEHEETVEDVYQTKCSNKHVNIIDTSGNVSF